jgi:hypothetical protein
LLVFPALRDAITRHAELYDSNAARTNRNYNHQAAKMTDKQMLISLSVIETSS